MDEIEKKIEELQRRHTNAMRRKAELTGQLEAKKMELATLVQEIKDAGYDPKNIKQERDRVKIELESMISSLDQDLTRVETALDSYKTTK
jgi:uncharacterized protein YceH (UPF0502 family)